MRELVETAFRKVGRSLGSLLLVSDDASSIKERLTTAMTTAALLAGFATGTAPAVHTRRRL